MRPKKPEISAAEWMVMRQLWKRAPQTAAELIRTLSAAEGWHPNTIKTLLRRLHGKGVVAVDKRHDPHLFSPLISEDARLWQESANFLQRWFDGAVKPFLTHFVTRHPLTAEEADELRAMLEKHLKQERPRKK
jgi:BlaI family transcriptional regulator, penicillinase repressor